MVVKDVLILGAGPSGLSTAIALAKIPATPDAPRLRITIVEIRPELKTIGGTINVTPLAMRYLDYMGAGERVQDRSIPLDHGLDYISLRTGSRMGNIWGGIGARRIARHGLVSSLLETVQKNHSDSVEIQWGRRVTEILEANDKVVVKFQDSDTPERFDIMIGCDGIHSAARRLWVDPDRQKSFVGRVAVMGWNQGSQDVGSTSPLTLASGEPALRDTAVINGNDGILLSSYYEATRKKVYMCHIQVMDEPKSEDARDGWKSVGDDKISLRKDIIKAYESGKIDGIQKLVEETEDWHLWPVYVLPGDGRWYRGRVLLMGDASHAMPPQGESTGFAIEDGIAIAHVLSRRGTRTVEQLFSDMVALRKPFIDTEYKNAIWRMENGFVKTTGYKSILLEWGTALFLLVQRWRQNDHFAGDVRDMELPA